MQTHRQIHLHMISHLHVIKKKYTGSSFLWAPVSDRKHVRWIMRSDWSKACGSELTPLDLTSSHVTWVLERSRREGFNLYPAVSLATTQEVYENPFLPWRNSKDSISILRGQFYLLKLVMFNVYCWPINFCFIFGQKEAVMALAG